MQASAASTAIKSFILNDWESSKKELIRRTLDKFMLFLPLGLEKSTEWAYKSAWIYTQDSFTSAFDHTRYHIAVNHACVDMHVAWLNIKWLMLQIRGKLCFPSNRHCARPHALIKLFVVLSHIVRGQLDKQKICFLLDSAKTLIDQVGLLEF